mgnify:CR=1 FL=1
MDMQISPQIMHLIVTLVALVIAGIMYVDMCLNGMFNAAPRDSVALVLFAVVRWFVGRTMRSATPTPDSTED